MVMVIHDEDDDSHGDDEYGYYGDEVEITISNFASVFNYMSDTIGEYSFKDDGLVILNYYKDLDYDDEERAMDQMKELRGSWSLKGSHVTINWETNAIFPNNTLELDIVDQEYGEYSLKGKGKHQLWMGM